MIDATRILLTTARFPTERGWTEALPLGVAYKGHDGWRFKPFTSAHRGSRKGHPTWENAVPRWTGHPNRTESRRIEPGQTVADVLRSMNKEND